MIKAEIVGHSVSPQGDELISVLATFPRIVLAEVNTHRMLSKNTSSSRAIPFNKMVEAVQENPFIPIAWQKAHSGMQGNEYFEEGMETIPFKSIHGTNLYANNPLEVLQHQWLCARDKAVEAAYTIHSIGATKQMTNRLLEPFMWTTMLITGPKSGWDNFFHLRCPSYDLSQIKIGEYNGMTVNPICKSWKEVVERTALDLFDLGPSPLDQSILKELEDYTEVQRLQINKGQAEIHMMDLAEKIYDAVNESTPKQLQAGEWHIPFENKISKADIFDAQSFSNPFGLPSKVKISVAMAARTSYTMVGEEKTLDYDILFGLHDRLLTQTPPHSSPLEHCAKAMNNTEYYSFFKGEQNITDESELDIFTDTNKSNPGHGWCNNFKGFIPYRYLVDNELAI